MHIQTSNVWLLCTGVFFAFIAFICLALTINRHATLRRKQKNCTLQEPCDVINMDMVESSTEHATNAKFVFPVFAGRETGLRYRDKKGIRAKIMNRFSEFVLFRNCDENLFTTNVQQYEDAEDVKKLAICSGLLIVLVYLTLFNNDALFWIVRIFVTTFPVILGGIFDHICIRTKFFQSHKKPLDGGKTVNGKRLFGDNKTWIGLISMIFSCMLSTVLWGVILKITGKTSASDLYLLHDNTVLFNAAVGFVVGLVYELCELPNSFLKRQVDIQPGLSGAGIKGFFFFILDQIDATIGLGLVIKLISDIPWSMVVAYILVGGVFHLLLDMILYVVGLRKNIF